MIQAIRLIENTKTTHDHWETGEVYNYSELVKINVPAIGIPGINNRMVIIDVDAGGREHTHDGRGKWGQLSEEHKFPATYTVMTENGGYHYYYKLPAHMDADTFFPKGKIDDGIDIKYRGYVRCPPTKGFTAIHSSIEEAITIPIALMTLLVNGLVDVDTLIPPDEVEQALEKVKHNDLLASQIAKLREQIAYIQEHVALDYESWKRGLISMKSGIPDEEVLEELAMSWTYGLAYCEGDEHKAMQILDNCDSSGRLGPGAIFEIIKDLIPDRNEVPMAMLSKAEIIDKAGVPVSLDKHGAPVVKASECNICEIINQIPALSTKNVYSDIRKDSYMMNKVQVDDMHLVDVITPMLQSAVRGGLGFQDFRRAHVASAVQILMTGRRTDPHLDFLLAAEWDGVPRVEKFFSTYLYTEDSPYTQALGNNLWTALAARGIDPGCKMDNILIIEGAEGIRKSSLVEIIAGDYALALGGAEKINSPETLRSMHQATVVEVPEMVGLANGNGDDIKAALARSTDKIRGLYARKAIDRKRGFILIGTTNGGEYLNQSMGDRRYWPIAVPPHVEAIDLEGVKRDRTQLFAEGKHRYLQGESYWEMPKVAWKEQIQERKLVEPMHDAVAEILWGSEQVFFRLDEIFQFLKLSGFIVCGLDAKTAQRIRNSLHHLKAVREKVNMGPGRKVVMWRRPDLTSEGMI